MSRSSLHVAEQALMNWLSGCLGESEQEVLVRLLSAPHTSLEAGRMTQLSLRGIAGELADADPSGLTERLAALTELDYLDVSGLGLQQLDLSRLERLRVLECSDNDLPHLDLAGCPRLVRLWCAGNRLMVLDVSNQAGLVDLNCAGNEIASLVLPQGGHLEVLRCERNQLIVLEVGDQPALRELACFRNGMHELRWVAAPALELLDCARNELKTMQLPPMPRLRKLNCSRNALGELVVGSLVSLEELGCWRNYIQRLDLSKSVGLKELRCQGNQLRELDLSALQGLQVCDASDNRLRGLSGLPAGLLSLDVCGNELTALDVASCPKLCVLAVAGNELGALDLSNCPGLARLSCGGNALKTLNIRANPELCELELHGSSAAPEVQATEALRRRLPVLRDRTEDTSAGRDIPEMNAWALHDLALSLIGRGSERELRRIAEADACDLGTAMLIYWTSAPHYFTQYEMRDEVEPYEQDGWDLLRSIEERVDRGAYAEHRIWFNPQNDKQAGSLMGRDWTLDRRRVRRPVRTPIPAHMWDVQHVA